MTDWQRWFQSSVDHSGDTIASAHYDSDRSFKLNQRAVLERLGEVRGQRILDVGPATGHFCQPLTAHNEVIGLDFVGTMLHYAANKGLIPVQGDGMQLPFPTYSMDTVICVGVLQHVPDPAALVRELLRVCHPSGQLFIQTLNRQSLVRWLYYQVTRETQLMPTFTIPQVAGYCQAVDPALRLDAATLYYPLSAYRWVGIAPRVSQYLSTSFVLQARRGF
jgi:ubiquinone/menaquinone biosynthesis C-methylase UbiE